MPTRPGAIPVRRLPPRNGQPLPPRPRTPSRDAFVTRHQQGFTRVRPSSLPLTCGQQTARRPLGFPLSFTPPGTRYPDACQGRDRSPALTRATCPASAEPPAHNHSQRATSCRNRSQNRTAAWALRGQLARRCADEVLWANRTRAPGGQDRGHADGQHHGQRSGKSARTRAEAAFRAVSRARRRCTRCSGRSDRCTPPTRGHA